MEKEKEQEVAGYRKSFASSFGFPISRIVKASVLVYVLLALSFQLLFRFNAYAFAVTLLSFLAFYSVWFAASKDHIKYWTASLAITINAAIMFWISGSSQVAHLAMLTPLILLGVVSGWVFTLPLIFTMVAIEAYARLAGVAFTAAPFVQQMALLGMLGLCVAAVIYLAYTFSRLAKNWHQLERQLADKSSQEAKHLEIAQKMAEGEFDIAIQEGFMDRLTETLATLRENLRQAAEREHVEKFINAGLAQASEIMRNESQNLQDLSDKIITFIVKYLQANQGALFIVDKGEDEGHETKILLKSCYAYERKKFVNRELKPGEGMVGQTYLEKKYNYMTQVPQGYVNITSGLGDATPGAVLIMPCMLNEEVFALVEIASFHQFKEHEISFLQKLGENIASSINNTQITHRTRTLLEESQNMAEEMRSQEEELRQNMEELQATQEEMERKQAETEATKGMLDMIIDLVPFPIFVKDHERKYSLANKAESELYGTSAQNMIGHDDSFFIADESEMNGINASDDKVLVGQQELHLPEQVISFPGGAQKVLKTIKVPFTNNITGKTNILGVSLDLTDMRNVEKELEETQNELIEANTKLYDMERKLKAYKYEN